ncbi:unnamed protein product [Thelazia callipaeda]|uniref:LRAT domain-containing protein n=1 Tax=Thelazia callipaeda TaxID=103827 RepID=A0A0N5D1D8_THECL|nr:unnamed protein product [Thelazia callipaeda]
MEHWDDLSLFGFLVYIELAEPSSSSEEEDGQPPSLSSFGYHFDADGVMRDEGGETFKFIDQKSYEEIGHAVSEEIYRIMEKSPYNMNRQYLNCKDKKRSAFIFVSSNWNKKKYLVVLIHGSGAVRAGQWSRRLIMNENLNVGSQLPYLVMCNNRDWGVVVLNTNMNHYKATDGSLLPLPESATAIEHGMTVWRTYIAKAEAISIAVIAHSAGGTVIAGIMENYWKMAWMKKLKCICLTDALFTLPSVAEMDWVPIIQDWRASSETVRLMLQIILELSVESASFGLHLHVLDTENMMRPGELVSNWMHAEEIRCYVEIGDLVEFQRVIGHAKRRIYTHWGVFIGFQDREAYIAHTGTDFGDFGNRFGDESAESLIDIKTKVSRSNLIQVRREELSSVARGDKCRINNSLDKEKCPFPPAVVVDRAILMLGNTNYNLLLNNCEHFAKYCRYGLRESDQAALVSTIIIASATFCITGSLTVAAVVGTLSYTFNHFRREIRLPASFDK